MYQIALLVAVCMFCLGPASGAAPLPPVKINKGASVYYKQFGRKDYSVEKLEEILASRAQRTKEQQLCKLAGKNGVVMEEDMPVEHMPADYFKGENGLYAYITFWKDLSPQARRDYFLAANNRAGSLVLRRQLENIKRIQDNLFNLWEGRKFFRSMPLEKLLVREIPEQTKYILLGEEHDSLPVLMFLVKFFREYRINNPKKKIFLLTEFLPAEEPLPSVSLRHKKTASAYYYTLVSWLCWMKENDALYASVFNNAISAGISVRGLEPGCMYQKKKTATMLFGQSADWGVLPEGMRLRNQAWLKQIQALRQQEPDAVFIVYAGEAHTAYNAPFNISQALPPEETFVVHLFPEEKTDDFPRDLLDSQSQGIYPFDTKNVLAWKLPYLSRVSGFDMRLLIPAAYGRESKEKK